MLERIVTEEELGIVIGEASSGGKAISPILSLDPDIVLIDLLMPELDGIETMERVKKSGFRGQFIMISQIENKEMVGEAYEKGVEFFIHKPINKIEVKTILARIEDQLRMKHSFHVIQESLARVGPIKTPEHSRRKTVKEIVIDNLGKMGMLGEAGCDDLISIIELLMAHDEKIVQIPPLKELYEAVAGQRKKSKQEIEKESKAIEQRIRRALLVAINHLASLGTIDYMNPEFEYYAPRYFEFDEVRKQMLHLQEGGKQSIKARINIKKFLQVLYMETKEKFNV